MEGLSDFDPQSQDHQLVGSLEEKKTNVCTADVFVAEVAFCRCVRRFCIHFQHFVNSNRFIQSAGNETRHTSTSYFIAQSQDD